MQKRKALISVSDKSNLIELAQNLIELDFELISTGGTAKFLLDNNISVTEVSQVTNFPECFDGRVKTLHPNIHGGLLARRDLEAHMQKAIELNISMIDLLVVNLYPFFETIKSQPENLEACIEEIDIGGPAMLRSGAKNFSSVTVLTDINDYEPVILELRENGKISQDTNLRLAAKVFSETSFYDSLISDYLSSQINNTKTNIEIKPSEKLTIAYEKITNLRYGENPNQAAEVFRKPITSGTGLADAIQLHGKELSYNNYADTDAALAMIKEFTKPTVVAVKHSNPCGIASADNIIEAWDKTYKADSVSIFGGIIVQNRPVNKIEAEKMSEVFLEVILAPDFDEEALEILKQKKNIRLLKLEALNQAYPENSKMVKEIFDGLLVQAYDQHDLQDEPHKVVTKKKPEEADLADYLFAMRVVKHVKSNAIVLVKDEQTVGIGPGQPNRITSANIAIKQAGA
ncbi:MAG: bifunctional phosphoribosylaminoimidazolecarboxamide formyltransferase/IMP cyclohydrolase, partial [Clostridiaceae bacterium]|nr:bifunctional phosphoribosylaminoimidazolecarboxamide formyltransferase/IMP cyclohydrolase [Clostridiaceae bacterium]